MKTDMIEAIFVTSSIAILLFFAWGFYANKKLYRDNPVFKDIEMKRREIEEIERHMDNFEKLESLEEYARILKSRM